MTRGRWAVVGAVVVLLVAGGVALWRAQQEPPLCEGAREARDAGQILGELARGVRSTQRVRPPGPAEGRRHVGRSLEARPQLLVCGVRAPAPRGCGRRIERRAVDGGVELDRPLFHGALTAPPCGIRVRVDGNPVDFSEHVAYRGLMLAGVPNVTMTVGYVNASWTLRADLVSRYVARLLGHLRDRGLGTAVPVAPDGMTAGPIMDLTAGYVQRVIATFPKVGDRAPWTMPQSYVKDKIAFRRADVTQDMFFAPLGAKGVALPQSAPAPAELPLPGSSSNADGTAGDLVDATAAVVP